MGPSSANVQTRMKQLVFATANPNKVKEVQALLPPSLHILGLRDIGCLEELPETHDTLEANSREKAEYVFTKYGFDCFSEDTGLEIEALYGEPGVDTAHYAGSRDPIANMQKVLKLMKGETNRKARFRTVFTLILGGQYFQFEGFVTGQIAQNMQGTNGFGYDPIFIPDGYQLTFAELDTTVKYQMSHRAKACHLMTDFLTHQL